jgi:hypothetical protein
MENVFPTVQEARSALGPDETLIGVQWLRNRPEGPPCPEGCFAPGSSPHWHTTVTGWRVIGTRTTAELDTFMTPVRSTIIHRLEGGNER